MKYKYLPIDRLVYIWARYEGKRDASVEGKSYDESDMNELIRRLKRFKEDPNSFNEGFENDEEEE